MPHGRERRRTDNEEMADGKLMEVSVALNLMLLSVDGEVIIEDNGEIRVPPGSESELPLSLTIPPEFADMHQLKGVVSMEYRTLFDLIGITISIEMEGGE